MPEKFKVCLWYVGLAALAASISVPLLASSVQAQFSPDDVFGSPGATPDQTSNQSAFNQCVTGNCEPQRAECVAAAGSDTARLALCEQHVTRCLDACRAGDASFRFPPPSPAPRPLSAPEPEPQPEQKIEPKPAPSPESEAVRLQITSPVVRPPDPALPPIPAPPAPKPATEAIPPLPPPPPPSVPDHVRSAVQDFEKSTENVSGGFGLIVPSAEEGRGPGRGDAVRAYIDSCSAPLGLSESACKELLISSLGFEDCAAAGFLARESCVAWLTSNNSGVFPGCENLSPERCEILKPLKTIEYLPAGLKQQADEVAAKAQAAGVVIPIAGITSVNEESAKESSWKASRKESGQETSDFVIIVGDLDRDGIPDILQAEPPSSGDSTAKAVTTGVPLGQPRGAGETDPDFGIRLGGENFAQVERDRTAPVTPDVPPTAASTSSGLLPDYSLAESVYTGRNENWNFGGENALTISGTCLPDSTCLVYVYSYIPMVLTVKSDASGNWTYDISKSVADGSHVAYVAVTDETGKVVKKSSPFSFLVREAQAADPETFLATAAAAAEPEARVQRRYVYGAAALIAFAGALAWAVSRKKTAVS